jgi:hypothetical protein
MAKSLESFVLFRACADIYIFRQRGAKTPIGSIRVTARLMELDRCGLESLELGTSGRRLRHWA